MLSVDEAAARTLALVPRLEVEEVPLDDAAGRVLAEDLVAARALPAADNSAMDGFAVRASDLPGTLPVVAHVAAGAVPGALSAGGAARIMTGASMPAGADTVVIFEDARTVSGERVSASSTASPRGATGGRTDDQRTTGGYADEHAEVGGRVVLPAATAGDNVRRRGEDIEVGERAIAAGTRLGWGELGLAAALGCTSMRVARRPTVAIVATGDELVDVATTPGPGQLVDSSAHALRAQIAEAGGIPRYLGIARDDAAAVRTLVEQALACDVVITTGGVSAGDHDHVRGALEAAGVRLDFWKVAMKPGKPLAAGRAGDTAVFALPGNPVSSLLGFELFVRPALLAMQGVPAARCARPRAPVVLPAGYRKPPGRAHFLRAALHRDGERLVATLHPRQGSAMLTSLVGLDALVEIAADLGAVEPGGQAPARLLRAV